MPAGSPSSAGLLSEIAKLSRPFSGLHIDAAGPVQYMPASICAGGYPAFGRFEDRYHHGQYTRRQEGDP